MNLEIETTSEGKKTIKRLLSLPSVLRDSFYPAMQKTTFFIQNSIQDRTEKGKDVKGRLFEPYSEYSKKKRQGKGLKTNRVDLYFRGEMMASMTNRIASDGKSATIFFSSQTEANKAVGHNEGVGKLPKRRFFAVSPKQEKQAVKVFEKEVGKSIDKAGL